QQDRRADWWPDGTHDCTSCDLSNADGGYELPTVCLFCPLGDTVIPIPYGVQCALRQDRKIPETTRCDIMRAKCIAEIPAPEKTLSGIRPFAHSVDLAILDPRPEFGHEGGELDLCFKAKETRPSIIDLELGPADPAPKEGNRLDR